MAGVDAAADLGMVVLDRLGDRFDLGVTMARAVVVDADGDIELLDQLVQIVEAGGIGVGGKIRSPKALANSKVRRLASASLPKRNDAVADDASRPLPSSSCLIASRRFRIGIHRHVGGVDSQ